MKLYDTKYNQISIQKAKQNKIYLHTRNHIYLEYFNEELIVLDLRKNNYVVFTQELSSTLFAVLKVGLECVNGRYFCVGEDGSNRTDISEHIEALRPLNILSDQCYTVPYPKPIEKRKILPGVANVDWRLQQGDLDKKVSTKLLWKFYLTLIKVHLIVNVFGFYSLIKMIKRKKKPIPNPFKENSESLYELTTALNRACFYFPIRTKCLEWAAALTLVGIKKKIPCNLEIGVQTLPFFAHAWVNVEGNIVADVPDLPKNLAVILSEPFTGERK